MGFFDSLKIFQTRQQIEEALYRVKSLDAHQREVVLAAFGKELDDNGVSVEEIKRVVRELHLKKVISDIDTKELLSLTQQDK